jgi:hypothetical protein
VQNGDHYDLGIALHYEPAIVAYNGVINRAPIYAQYDPATQVPLFQEAPYSNAPRLLSYNDAYGVNGGSGLNWNKASGAVDPNPTPPYPSSPPTPYPDFSDPPHQFPCQIIGALARTPYLYYPPGPAVQGTTCMIQPHAPVIFDIEGTTNFSLPNGPASSPEDKIKYMQAMIDAVLAIKLGAGELQEVWWYFTDAAASSIFGPSGLAISTIPASVLDKWYELLGLLAGVCRSQYYWDWMSESMYPSSAGGGRSGYWYASIMQGEATISKYFPPFTNNGGKMVFLNPMIQTYWLQNDLPGVPAHDEMPVPMSDWTVAVDWFVDNGYQIYFWNTALVEKVRPQMEYLGQYAIYPPPAPPPASEPMVFSQKAAAARRASTPEQPR